MVTETEFRQWLGTLPTDQQGLLERIARDDPKAAYALCPRPPSSPHTGICVHEAAHAAAMHVFGIRIDHAFAQHDNGAVQPAKRDAGKPIDHLAFGVVMLAGDMAEQSTAPLTRSEWLATIKDDRPEATKDEIHAVIFARALAGCDPSADNVMIQIKRIWNTAVDVFEAPGFWSAIHAVSAILRRDGHIPGQRVHELCEQHLPFGALAHLTETTT